MDANVEETYREAHAYAGQGEYHAAMDRVLACPKEEQVRLAGSIKSRLRTGWSSQESTWLEFIARSPLRRPFLEQILKRLPECSEVQALRGAFKLKQELDDALAATATALLRRDFMTYDADTLLAFIVDENQRHQTALACVETIIAEGRDKWAFKFAMRMVNDISRTECACKAIAYIVELGVRPFAEECETRLREETLRFMDEIDRTLVKTLYQRGGKKLVERWVSWKQEWFEEVLGTFEAWDRKSLMDESA